MLEKLSDLRSVVRRWLCGRTVTRVRYPLATTSSYYQDVHDTNEAYKINNWLISEIDSILSAKPQSVLEIGCGNGRFLSAIKGRVEQVIGVDWAKSPLLEQLGVSANFEQRDITRDDLPQVDLVCSADVLEHLEPQLLQPTLWRLHKAGRDQYHVIACYDDGHSHLSIMNPNKWLREFRSMSPRYRILDVRFRRDETSQPVCIIATFDPRRHAVSKVDLGEVPAPPARAAL